MKNSKLLKNIGIFLASFAIYFLATYPTRNLFTVFTVTDVRPGAALNPLISMCFGPYAILGVALATTLGDYLSGYPNLVLIQGIVFQYIYGYLSYITWKKLTSNDSHRYRLDSLNKILKFSITALVFAISSAIGVGFIVYSNFGANGFETFGFVFLNNFDSTMVIGMPLLIVLNLLVHRNATGEKRNLSKNELIILRSVLVDVLSLCIIIAIVYRSLNGISSDIYTIWNTIYYYGCFAINLIMISTGIYIYFENRKLNNK